MLNVVINSRVKRVISLLLSGGASDCLLVGGFVRDHFLGLPSKDIDIEVYGLTYEKIMRILNRHFQVHFVGQSFGTIKIDNEIDINIPRIESKSGVGHKGFDILCDPNLDMYSAFSRRDFTINAIGIHVDGSIYDPFDGINDINCKILRATTVAFCEDPLRVLRGMQFAARFGFTMESGTVELCKRVFNEFDILSAERVWGEWFKWGSKGTELSRGLFLLQETGWIQHFPELAKLINVTKIQNSNSNSTLNLNSDSGGKICGGEDAFVNTANICDFACKIADELKFDEDDRLVLIFAALCYNFGKTEVNANGNGTGNDLLLQKLSGSISNLKSGTKFPDSVSKSFHFANRFLDRFKPPLRIVNNVLSLVGESMTDEFVLGKIVADDNFLRHLAVRLEPSGIRLWAALCRAVILANGNNDGNNYGNNDVKNALIRQVEKCELRAAELGVIDSKPKPILQGRDLITRGVNAGREMGIILDNAYKAQLNGAFKNIDEAISWYEEIYNS
ncbi:MAG: hypothetical protein LBT09_12485 [Planctomycetaceae bacterium]|jgi:tRNA nucleotidyltransferase (CCA-adding enzyme)|nr:hypothetical protein [Planctomycetaceae bacterium]